MTRLMRVAKMGKATRLARVVNPGPSARSTKLRLGDLIKVARGDAPADLVIVNAQVVNTFTGEIEHTGVAIHQDKIAGVSD